MAETKELKEVLAGVALLGKVGAKVLKDKKVSVSDVVYTKDLYNGLDVLKEAIKGIEKVPSEVKSLSTKELIEIGKIAVEIVNDIRKGLES